MGKYKGDLPDGCCWREEEDKQTSQVHRVYLCYGGLQIAAVQRSCQGWLVTVDPRYLVGVPDAVVVAGRGKGQAWLSKIVKLRKAALDRVCQRPSQMPGSINHLFLNQNRSTMRNTRHG